MEKKILVLQNFVVVLNIISFIAHQILMYQFKIVVKCQSMNILLLYTNSSAVHGMTKRGMETHTSSLLFALIFIFGGTNWFTKLFM